MKRIFSLLLAVSMLVGAVAVLSSCGAPENAGAEIKVYLGEPIYDFDPTDYYSDSNADQMMGLLFEPLFAIDEDGDIECAAAEDYEVEEENRTINITLRESYWSDGVSQVLAEDFIYAWRDVLLEPGKPNPAAALLYDIENALEIKQGKKSTSEFGATAAKFDITIKYREGADYEQLLRNLASVATSPIKQDSVSQAPTYWSKSSNTLVTNGPFRISTLNYLTGELVLDRNLGYHQLPTIEDYDDEVIPSKLVSFISTSGNKVQYTYADVQDKIVFFMSDAPLSERAENKGAATVADDLSTYTYVFNTENPLFAKKYVRQALSLAIDRATIVNALTFAKAADGFLPDSVYQNSDKMLINANAKLDVAANLLNLVDFTGLDKSFTLTINDDEESLAMAEIVVEGWKYLGFDVTVKPVSSKTVTVVDFSTNSEMEVTDSEIQIAIKEASYGNMTFDVIGMDWQMYSSDAFVALSAFSSNMNGYGATFNNPGTVMRTNITGWSNKEYDSYIESAYNSTGDTRTEYLRKAEALLVDSAVVVPVVYNQTFAYINEDIDDVEINGLGNFVLTQAELEDYEQYLTND